MAEAKLEFTFGQWLKKQVGRSGAIGDIARDYVAEGVDGRKCCGRFQRYDTILRHIRSRHQPCSDAEEALRKAYDEYQGIVRFR